MRKAFLALAVGIVVSLAASAQSGSNQIGIGAEAGIPTGKDASETTKIGLGGSLKGLFGIGNAGQITLTTGYMSFGSKNLPDGFKSTLNIIPAMAGYRQNFSGFYVEPQAGVGFISEKDKFQGESETVSVTKFTWAAGIGYVISNVDIGARYQRSEFKGGSISLIGIKIAYNIPVGGK
ncbi:porin family protein [Ilyomonas limi]|uniref:Porin family protein n=1 Tax=Ilyomonas limi TaxID=2575867 RepID=A0A4U3KZ37_9BACT|nr:outer membrane beta-barrel protein [Ilyomonas limi]TKK67692.1 porin family protein [Ilyomonas limi]